MIGMRIVVYFQDDVDVVKKSIDNLLFLINRIEMMDPGLMAMEPEVAKLMIDAFLNS